VIFGSLSYEMGSAGGSGATSAGSQKQSIIVLNTINMDIIDFISPAYVSDIRFRAMWAAFEWENKVAVNTDIADLNEYLNHILHITNMKCLTPQSTMSGQCAFLSANLYALSVFGEDALLNLSVEKQAKDNRIEGYIRIRSKTQGIALSLGDKITAKQRGSGAAASSGAVKVTGATTTTATT